MQLFHLSCASIFPGVFIQVKWLTWESRSEGRKSVQRIALIPVLLVMKYLLGKRSVLPPNPMRLLFGFWWFWFLLSQWDSVAKPDLKRSKEGGSLLWVTPSISCGPQSSTMPPESRESTTATKNNQPWTKILYLLITFFQSLFQEDRVSWTFPHAPNKTWEWACGAGILAVCCCLK